MDTWVHEMVRTRSRRRVAAWGFVLACAVAFVLSQHRYVSNFLMGPFIVTGADLDSIKDVSTAPRYFVSVTGSRAIDTGIQEITSRKRGGVETSRSVSAIYYVLVVGERLLVVKGSEGTPLTVEGELTPMSASLQNELFNGPRMELIRPRFYPYYVDNGSFRAPGYVALVGLLILAALLVLYARPAWRFRQDVSAHPVVKRVAAWGDPVGLAVDMRREAGSPRHKGSGVLRLSDLLWAYKRVTKHSVNFIPTGKSYAGVLACYGGSAEIKAREKKVDTILAFAAERTPWAIFGFSDELNTLFSKKTPEFCAAVERRKQEWAHRPQA